MATSMMGGGDGATGGIAVKRQTSVEDVRSLMEKKDRIEAEIKELYDVLQSQEGVGMDGPLVDKDQYPRSDIDVYTVRHARHQIICLQNDHKALMEQIEEGLYAVHAAARQQDTSQPEPMEQEHQPATLVPFAGVDCVDPNSPAMEAGLTVGDELVRFGSVVADNFRSLKDIGELVQHSKGKSVNVTVIRNGETVHLAVIPKSWSGRGLLGCNIIPKKPL